jgi:hypothetical protein
MSRWNNRPKCSQIHFVKNGVYFYHEKNLRLLLNLKKLSKVNDHPMGVSNLVNLFTHLFMVKNASLDRFLAASFAPRLPDGLFSYQIWINFGGPLHGKCWYILWPLGIFYCHLVKFVVIWYIFPVLVCLHLEKSGNLFCTPGSMLWF